MCSRFTWREAPAYPCGVAAGRQPRERSLDTDSGLACGEIRRRAEEAPWNCNAVDIDGKRAIE